MCSRSPILEAIGRGDGHLPWMRNLLFEARDSKFNWWSLLGGSWACISGFISPLIWVISTATLLVTTHEPPIVPGCVDNEA